MAKDEVGMFSVSKTEREIQLQKLDKKANVNWMGDSFAKSTKLTKLIGDSLFFANAVTMIVTLSILLTTQSAVALALLSVSAGLVMVDFLLSAVGAWDVIGSRKNAVEKSMKGWEYLAKTLLIPLHLCSKPYKKFNKSKYDNLLNIYNSELQLCEDLQKAYSDYDHLSKLINRKKAVPFLTEEYLKNKIDQIDEKYHECLKNENVICQYLDIPSKNLSDQTSKYSVIDQFILNSGSKQAKYSNKSKHINHSLSENIESTQNNTQDTFSM